MAPPQKLTLQELQAMGAKPEAPQQASTRMTLAELQAAGAKPVPSMPPATSLPVDRSSAGDAFVHGVGNTFGTGDVIGAGIQADLKGITNIPALARGEMTPLENLRSIYDEFQKAREGNRYIAKRDRETQPGAYLGGQVTGAIATAPLLPATGLKTVAGLGAVQGATAGAAESDSDSVGGALEDAAIGGALGAAGGALGYGLGKGVEKGAKAIGGRVAGFANEQVANATTKARGMAASSVDDALASMRGELGAATQDANRAVEVLTSHLGDSLTPEQAARMAQLEADGVLPALREKLADSVLDKIPGAAGKVDAKRLAYEAAQANRSGAIDASTEALLSPGEAMSQVKARVQRYAAPLAGTLLGSAGGAGVGLAVGNDPIDAAIGGLAGAGARPAMHAVRRMAQHPAVQKAVFTTVEDLARNGAHLMGEYAPMLTSALGRGPAALAATDYVMSQRDPNYRQKKEAAQKAATGKQ